jgi:hypothetical protein
MLADHNVQQVSFKVRSLADVRAFYHRLLDAGIKIDRTVTHGIACSVLFLDPEDNRIELYYTTPYQVRQPLGEPLDVDRPDHELLAFAKSFEESKGPPRGLQSPRAVGAGLFHFANPTELVREAQREKQRPEPP